jgi:hypothetical protein
MVKSAGRILVLAAQVCFCRGPDALNEGEITRHRLRRRHTNQCLRHPAVRNVRPYRDPFPSTQDGFTTEAQRSTEKAETGNRKREVGSSFFAFFVLACHAFLSGPLCLGGELSLEKAETGNRKREVGSSFFAFFVLACHAFLSGPLCLGGELSFSGREEIENIG